MRGCFITFEGGEGSGKSTQVERISRRIEAAGQPVIVTREPGGSPRAERIRVFILSGGAKKLGVLAETVLFSAARMDHLRQTIRPALKMGKHVVCDRFSDSTRAYQGVLGRLDEGIIAMLERVVLDGTEPDLTFVLDLPATAGLERARHRREEKGEGVDRFEAEGPAFHEALRQAFLKIAVAEPDRCVVIDASRDLDEVEDALWKALRERLPQVTGDAARAHVGS